MAVNNLSRKILEISQRVENIHMQSLRDPGHAAEILADAIKELQISIEELSVAEEKLYLQSEELVDFRNASEAERQRYMELFNQAPDGYLVTDPEGNIQEANCAASAMLNVRQDLLVGRPMIDFVTDAYHPAFRTYLAGLRQGAEVSDWELLLQPLESASTPVSLSVSFVRDSKGQLTGLRWLLHDITARKKIEKARQAANDILEINNLHNELKPFLSDCVAYLKNFSGCAAVGIRILDKDGNIPYQAYGGFSQSFFEMESPLSIKSDLCMCINVVKGETDPALPFYTRGGSFYMNGTTRFLATVSEEAKGQTRNVCNKIGYESVALIPIRLRDKILGLIHLADPRENMVPLYLVEVIEQVGAQMGVALDRIQAEAALRESEAELKRVTDGVPLPLAHVSSDLKYIFVNQSYADWFQIPKEEIIGRHITEVLSQEGYEATLASIKRALSGERADYELVILKNGQPRTLNMAFIPQLDRHGAVWSYYTITQDITERQQAEEALHQSEERLRFVLETCRIGAWDMDIADHTTIRSPEHDHIYGYDVMLPKWTYEMFLEHVIPEDREWVDATYQHAVKTQSSWSFEFRIRRPDGQVRWIWATGSHRRDADGAVRRVAGIVQDVTERKRAEEALQEARDELEQRVQERTAELQNAKEELESINEELSVEIGEHEQTEKELMTAKEAAEASTRAKAEFLANMSHEIRTPMNAVIGMTSLLLCEQLTPEQRDFIETIRTSGDALMVIINDILDFSKMESGKVMLEEQPFDLRDLVEESLDLVAVKATEKGLNLAYTVDKNVPGKIIGDPNRLRQILVNLLNNAVKFTDKGEVKLFVSGNQDAIHEIHFAVQDTGIGIPEDKMYRLFQSFSQVETSTARLYGGTGLGLAISKRLVELMGGKIWVESEPGIGSTFHFTIRAESVPGESETHPAGVQPLLLGKCVLIVDDNKTDRRILGFQAYSWGMMPMTATSGQEALRWVRMGGDFDIAILDMNMPEMDGLTLAREIRKYNKTLPLVILTSIGQCVPSNHASLVKPIKPSQLYDILIDVFSKQPIQEPPQTPAANRAQERLPRILLAEDNVSSQKVVMAMLKRLGYSADAVANGIEALQALERQHYDVVLMDVRMPEMDGIAAAKEIRRLWPDKGPKIIAITAYALAGDREKCLEAGMDGYIAKPVRIEDLAAALCNTPVKE